MVTLQHEKGENEKFSGPGRDATTQPIRGPALTRRLNQLHYVLMPWTIDGFGQFGPCALRFLCGDRSPYTLRTADVCSQTALKPEGKTAFEHTLHPDCPTGFYRKADKKWRDLHDKEWLTPTCQAQTPSQWAKQCLAWSSAMPLATHFHNALRKATNDLASENKMLKRKIKTVHYVVRARCICKVKVFWIEE